MGIREPQYVAKHRRDSLPAAVRNSGRREEIQQEQREARGLDIRTALQALRKA